MGTISANKPDAWYETLTVFNISVKFNLNTGEQANIIPNSLLKNTNPSPTISQTNVKLKTYNSGEINIIGQIETMIQRQDVQQINLLFYIADLPTAQPLLGRNACIQVGLIGLMEKFEPSSILNFDTDLCENRKYSVKN